MYGVLGGARGVTNTIARRMQIPEPISAYLEGAVGSSCQGAFAHTPTTVMRVSVSHQGGALEDVMLA